MVFRSRLVNLILNVFKLKNLRFLITPFVANGSHLHRRSERNTQDLLLYNKSQLSLDKFTQVLCLVLIGFLVGNLFGTFLNTIRKYIAWDGIIVFFIISIIEISNYNVYHNKNRAFLFILFRQNYVFFIDQNKAKSFWKFFNFFKIGLMVGFFVDAFKVGS